jgi:hypothetical protein
MKLRQAIRNVRNRRSSGAQEGGTSDLSSLAFPSQEADGYDHDAVGLPELDELCGGSSEADSTDLSQGLPERQSRDTVSAAKQPLSSLTDGRGTESDCPGPICEGASVHHAGDGQSQANEDGGTGAGAPQVEDQADGIDWLLATTEVPPRFSEDPPDVSFGADAILDFPQDLPEAAPKSLNPERVEEGERARQFAKAFLAESNEGTPKNIDRLTEIISIRGWSTVQIKVRELHAAGNSVKAIHRAFELSQAWRDANGFDEFYGDNVGPGGWRERFPSLLAWHEATQLVAFLGEDQDVESMLLFVESERHVWRRNPNLVRQYPHFKHYLVHFRISEEFRAFDGEWLPTLDPEDGRFFGGDVNPEYSSALWEDEPTSVGSSEWVAAQVLRGADVADFLQLPEDSLNAFGFWDVS